MKSNFTKVTRILVAIILTIGISNTGYFTATAHAQDASEQSVWSVLVLAAMGEPGQIMNLLKMCHDDETNTDMAKLNGKFSKKFEEVFIGQLREFGGKAFSKAKQEGRLDELIAQILESRKSIEIGMVASLGHLQEHYFTDEETRRVCKTAVSRAERYLRN
jgi:hypothetical protein